MAATPPFPYAIITTKNPFYARSPFFNRRVNFKSVDHARNYCRKVVKPDWFQTKGRWKNLNNIEKITVWMSPDEFYVWMKNSGWLEKV